MADENSPAPEAPALPDLASAIIAEVLTPGNMEKLRIHAQNVNLGARKDEAELGWQSIDTFIEKAAKALIEATGGPSSVLDPLARGAIDSLLSDNVGRGSVKRDAGQRLLDKIAGPATAVTPGTEGAARYLTLILHEEIEAWIRGVVVELITEFMPRLSPWGGGVETVQKLQDIIETALGGGRMVRRVLQPFVQATAITPAQWYANLKYRPELLSPAEAVRQHLRGRWSREQLVEELGRQGWSDDRIEAQLNAQRKFFAPGDVRTFVERGQWDGVRARQHLLDQGYDEATADDVLRLEGLHRIDQLEGDQATAILAAYAAREIDASTFQRLLGAAVSRPTEVALLTELGELRRALHIRRLNSGQVTSLVMDDILTVGDYRRALEREGYPPEDVAALELQLRKRKAEERAIEDLRRDQAEARDAEQQRQAEARAARLAELAVAKAQPALAAVRRAYVRGHVPLERLIEAFRFAHDGIGDEDLAALQRDAEQDRDEYLEAVARRKAAENADPDAAVPLASIERAVLRGILTLDDYARGLQSRGYDADESRLLVMLLRTTIEDQEEAQRERDAAGQRAALRGISLDAFERAVRLGLRTLAEYAALLEQLETPEIAKRLALDLLAAQLQQDAAALAKREVSEAAANVKHISLEQRRRAVLRGVRPRSYYARAVLDAGLSPDDQLVELALVDLELAEAEAARARREQVAREIAAREAREEADRLARVGAGDTPPPAPTLTLNQVERAVRLGLLAPDDLRDYLAERGYDEGDVELLVSLVVADVPDVRQGQQRRDQVSRELRAKGVALADFERGVRRGLRTVRSYAELLTAQGYGQDDVALLETLLEEEVAIDLDGLRAKIRKAVEAAGDVPQLEELEAALASGELAPGHAQRFLSSLGVARDAALVYVRLLVSGAGGA